MKNFFKDGWVNVFMFVYSSVFISAGMYLAISVIVENLDLSSWMQALNILIFVNIGVFVTYIGLKSQIRLYNDWNSDKKIK